MLQLGDNVILPDNRLASVQGWAIEKGLLDKGKPYRQTSRRKALASGNPLVKVWASATDTIEYWPLGAVVYVSAPPF